MRMEKISMATDAPKFSLWSGGQMNNSATENYKGLAMVINIVKHFLTMAPGHKPSGKKSWSPYPHHTTVTILILSWDF